MGKKDFQNNGNRVKLKGMVVASIEAMSSLQTKITGEQLQIDSDFNEIENFLNRKHRKIASHKHNILEAQKEIKEVSSAAISQLTEFLNN